MIEQRVTIINKLGLHARAATKLAKTCGQFHCKIQVGNDQTKVDGKSVMSLMLLAACKGTDVMISCDGDDETDAMTSILALINDRFGEGE